MKRFCKHDTPLGAMLLVADDEALSGAYFAGQKYCPESRENWMLAGDDVLLHRACDELDEYFDGRRQCFDVPLHAHGTGFQQAVWAALCDVPHGATVTYAELAGRIGMPGAARAVGAAVGRNPLTLFVPCHRALGSSGALTGYAGGLERKRALLELERPAAKVSPPIAMQRA